MMNDMCGFEGCACQILPSLWDWLCVHEETPAINCRAITCRPDGANKVL